MTLKSVNFFQFKSSSLLKAFPTREGSFSCYRDYQKLFLDFIRYYFVVCKINHNFAPEFIPHLREGNRKTQALKLCVFCFFIASRATAVYYIYSVSYSWQRLFLQDDKPSKDNKRCCFLTALKQ